MAKLTLQEVGAGYSAATDLNANNALLEAAVENTLSRDGTAPNQMEAQLDMNENRIINMADGINPQDAVTLSQIDDLIVGAGVVISVGAGTGIDVDNSTPSVPVVSVEAATVSGAALGATSAQRDDNFIVFSASANLTAERVLTAGSNITLDTSVAGLITIAATGGGVTDHGALTGLSDDDHPQYAEIANTESITGAWTFGANVNISDTFELIIGHSAAVLGDGIDVIGTSETDASIGLSLFANFATGPVLELSKSRSGTLGTNTIVQDNDVLGSIVALGADGTDYDIAARIEFRVDGTPGAGADMPGEIAFLTSPDGSATPADRMTISAAGAVHITKDSSSVSAPGLRIGDAGSTTTAAHLSIVDATTPTLVLMDTSGNAELSISVDTTTCNLSFDDGSGSGFFQMNMNGINFFLFNPSNDGTVYFTRPVDNFFVEAVDDTVLAATENNYAHGNHNVLFMTPAAGNSTMTGFVAPTEPSGGFPTTYQLQIVNVSATDNLILAHQNASSSAANRMILPAGASVTLLPSESAILTYYHTADRWYLLSRT